MVHSSCFLNEISRPGDAAHPPTHASMAEAKSAATRSTRLVSSSRLSRRTTRASASIRPSLPYTPTAPRRSPARADASLARPSSRASRRCASIPPTRARQRLGALAIKLGELDTATAAAEDALRADPESPGAIALVKQMRALRDGRAEGNAAFKAGDKPQARQIYTAALERAAAAAAASAAAAAASASSTPPRSPTRLPAPRFSSATARRAHPPPATTTPPRRRRRRPRRRP